MRVRVEETDRDTMTSLLQNENENETEKGTIEELQERVRLAETTLQDARARVVELCKAERGVQTDSDAIRQAKKRARSAKKNLKSSLHALKECKRITEKEGMMRQEAELRGGDMLATVIDEESDPRLDSYRNLKDSSDRRRQGKFIAEGPETISLLLKSDVRIKSLLLKPTVFEKLRPAIEQRFGESSSKVFVASASVMGSVVGYSVRRGALACGYPVERDEAWLHEHILREDRPFWRVLAVDGCNNTANLGSLVRTSTAFGVQAIMLSSTCCDCWYRKAVRVSMGHIFSMPVIRVDNLAETLRQLRFTHCMRSFGAVIDMDAVKMREVESPSPQRWCAVVGCEDSGISKEVRDACDHLVRIDMAPGVDSLSITVAAGVFLAGLRGKEEAERAW